MNTADRLAKCCRRPEHAVEAGASREGRHLHHELTNLRACTMILAAYFIEGLTKKRRAASEGLESLSQMKTRLHRFFEDIL